jgi:hypothetical protein
MVANGRATTPEAHLNHKLVGKILWLEQMRDPCEIE